MTHPAFESSLSDALRAEALPASSVEPSIDERVADAPIDERVADAPIDAGLLARWSRRAIDPRPVPFELIRTLFEAARFAPSAGNSQPWLFVYAADQPTRARAQQLLKEQNRRWAERAPLLVFIFARRSHPQTGQPLRTGAFDTGAAWFSLAVQAERLGLVTRAMGGIFHEATYAALGVPEDKFESMAAVAVGFPGDAPSLPADLGEKERPSLRKRQHEFVFNGRYVERES
jgi:nitroreductase